MVWRHISSAPKNREILGCCYSDEDEQPVYIVMFWDEHEGFYVDSLNGEDILNLKLWCDIPELPKEFPKEIR